MSKAALLVATGIVPGVAIGVASARGVRFMLFGAQPYDFPTHILAASVLIAVALAASLVPALRAVRLDTVATLRSD